MDTELVENIVNNIDICDYISNYIELKPKGDEYFGVCPFHNEDTASFSVTPARKMYFCFGCGAAGDVINFKAQYEDIPYSVAAKELAEQYSVSGFDKLKSETVAFLKETKSNRYNLPQVHHEILDKSVMDNFVKADIKEWIDEGIPQKIIDRYGVRMDVYKNRIVYPVYDNDGNLINVKGRTLYDSYKQMKISKYINYYKVGELDYFQGYSLKKNIIKDKGEIIIFEGIKSCMKLDSFGIYNSVSAETSRLNPYQIKFLVGLRCNVVIAFDNDVDYRKVVKNVDMLKRFTNVDIVYDKEGLLGDKCSKLSPVDKGREIWETLYSKRIRQ